MTYNKTVVISLTLAVFCVNAWAQAGAAAAKPAAPPPSATEQWFQNVKNPTPWLNWGADLRIRDEYFNNALTLSRNPRDNPATSYNESDLNEQNYIRFRSRLWTTVTPIPTVTNLSFYGRLANEAREWTRPAGYTAFRGDEGWDWRYGIVDNLNVKWKNILDAPLSVTAGRQDILLGDYYDWWLVIDGTPGDGSWTLFFDAIRGTYQADPIKTTFDVIYLYQNAFPDEWIPIMGEEETYLTEQTEMGTILYASNKSIKNTQIDGYFMYKRDDAKVFTPPRGTFRANGDNADIYTLGAKITGNFAENWKYSVEGAYQFGQKEDIILGDLDERDINAYGGKAKLTYALKDRLDNQFSLLYEYLSGDDPDTADDEMFDILWGRWPRYSELYLYSYAAETSGKIGQHNNLQRIGPSWSMVPIKNMRISATYNAMFAPQEVPTRALAPAEFSGDGNFRGHYLQALLQHKFNPHVMGHLWGEFVWQRDYYDTPELMTFLRAEMIFTF